MPTLLMVTPENTEINRFRAKQYNNFTQLTMPYLAGFVPAKFKIKLVDEYSQAVPYRTSSKSQPASLDTNQLQRMLNIPTNIAQTGSNVFDASQTK